MILDNLFPPEVATASSLPGDFREQIFKEEWSLVQKAVSKRQTEFCGGRLCAHRALEKLGVPVSPILSNPDRTPRWPDGIVGSISHTKDHCCAVVCRKGAIISIGLDVESATPLEDKLIKRICTDGERDWLQSQSVNEQGLLAKLIFCIKEAAYKCQYPLTRRFVEFHQAEVAVDLERQTFEVAFSLSVSDALPSVRIVPGRFSLGHRHILAGAEILQNPPT